MVIRLHARSAQIIVAGTIALVFLAASWAALRPWLAERLLSRDPTHETAGRALSLDPANHRIRAMIAALHHYSLRLRDYPAALAAYQSILRDNPLDGVVWLHLGKLYAALGRLSESDRALRLAAQLGQSNTALLWETAVAYLDQEQPSRALDTLTGLLSASENPSDLAKGYELARTLLTSEEMLDPFIPPTVAHYTRYANYLLDRNLNDQALAVWIRLADLAPRTAEPIDPYLQLRVVDLLMQAGRLDSAHQLWTAAVQRMGFADAKAQSNLVSNGSFEWNATVGRGFDWRIRGVSGVAASIDPFTAYTGRRSLRLIFTKSRADFSYVSQLVPIRPDATYALQAQIRTDGLTDPTGIAVEVIDPDGHALVTTDAITGTKGWTAVTAQFRASDGIEIVTLRVRKAPPPPYLPPISGVAWIDNVSLARVP